MARTVLNRREAYDNIAVGEVVDAREQTIAGEVLPPEPLYGGGSNIAVGDAYATAGTPHENIQVGTDLGTGENVAVGG